MVSKKSAQANLKTHSLPLSVDNIYTEIQKHLIEPYLVSSMMANDTFVKDWIVHNEDDVEKITKYLDSIKNKYEMLTAFLVSQKTKNYYTHNGFLEKVKEKTSTNKWYFEFKNNSKSHEINLDFNKNFTNSMIMFINFKIYNESYNFIGATGIGVEISYIDKMLQMFSKEYYLNVFFLNEDGKIVLTRQGNEAYSHIDEMKQLKKYKDTIISKETNLIEYKKDGDEYILKTKYIPELDIYLVVEAKLEKLANFDALTQLPNRRNFSKHFNQFLDLHKRDKRPISLMFMDIDNFKYINDELGHQVGDEVLTKVAWLLKQNIRKTDLIARWGGEEFIVAFIDTDIIDAFSITQKMSKAMKEDKDLQKLIGQNLTASFGLTSCSDYDTIQTIVSRADKAMYEAKENGKDKIIVNSFEPTTEAS